MSRPTIYADFHNADTGGRVRLNCHGTIQDLAEKRISLTNGLRLTLSDHEKNEVEGEVPFAEDEGLWVAVIDWNPLRQPAEIKDAEIPTGG